MSNRLSWLANGCDAARWLSAGDRTDRERRKQAARSYPLLVLGFAPGSAQLTEAIDSARAMLPVLAAVTGLPVPQLRQLRGVPTRRASNDPLDAMFFVSLVRAVFGTTLAAMPRSSPHWSRFWSVRRQLGRLFDHARPASFWRPYGTFEALVTRYRRRLPSALDSMADARDALAKSTALAGAPEAAESASMGELLRLAQWQALLRLAIPPSWRSVSRSHLEKCWRPWLRGAATIGKLRVRELRNAREVFEVAERFRNCAADFVASCHLNIRRLLIVEDHQGVPLSMFEVERPGRWNRNRASIGQHYGPDNAMPSAGVQAAVAASCVKFEPVRFRSIRPA